MEQQETLPSALAHENSQLKQQIYNEKKSKASTLFFILMISIFGNLFMVWLAFFYFPITQQIATSNATEVCKIPTVSEPFVQPEVAANFAVEAVVSLYSYDYVNYLRHINAATNKYMTPTFRDQYMKAFGDSATLRNVIENNFVVSANDGGKPAIIVSKGKKNGAYTWVIKVPLTISYLSGRKVDTERIIATVDVSREIPSSVNPTGIAVSMINTQHALN